MEALTLLMASYDAAQRKALERSLTSGEHPVCPACGARAAARPVAAPEAVSYVRRRVLVVCPACKRSGAVDVRGAGRP